MTPKVNWGIGDDQMHGIMLITVLTQHNSETPRIIQNS